MKAAPVDLESGALAADRFRIDTPKPATPKAVAKVVRKLVARHEWDGPVGVCMPSVVQRGVVRSAANIDPSWIDVDADQLFTETVGQPVSVLNDADAAGLAEVTWGAGRGRAGVVICLTFGTGIGSGVFVDGTLVPNTELGHLELDGPDIEKRAAASARERDGLSWEEWAGRVDHYLRHVVMLFSPQLIILGGGASKKPDRWLPFLDPGCELAIAQMANNAGIAGAALLAPERGADPSVRE
ncbi:MAG: ROK family protein [Ilumatobacter sp.]|nr:ROK family protein [Ilumatobacter sp.]